MTAMSRRITTYTPAGFDRATMTPTQEQVWLAAYVQEMQHAHPDSDDYEGGMTLDELAKFAAGKADLIASLVPLDSLPCHADRAPTELSDREQRREAVYTGERQSCP